MVSLVYSSEASVSLSLGFKHEHYTNKDFTVNIASNEILLLPEKVGDSDRDKDLCEILVQADSESSSVVCGKRHQRGRYRIQQHSRCRILPHRKKNLEEAQG